MCVCGKGEITLLVCLWLNKLYKYNFIYFTKRTSNIVATVNVLCSMEIPQHSPVDQRQQRDGGACS